MTYDSSKDTKLHAARVRELIELLLIDIETRSVAHDASKLAEPELSCFNKYTTKLKTSTYGSEEYKGFLAGMGEGLTHHYANNRHHPEYFSNGIDGMNLLDLLEMLMDWKAATERHDNGSINKSLVVQTERFNISPQLSNILKNTINDFKLGDKE